MTAEISQADARVVRLVYEELLRARQLHAPMHSAHEAKAVIEEEFEEFWAEVKRREECRDPRKMARELIQTAAMCMRALLDLGLMESDDANAPISI